MTERKNDRPRSKIKNFETVDVLHSDRVETTTATIGIVVEIQKPVFEDGREGFPRLSCVLSRASKQAGKTVERFFRLPCIRGDVSEVRAINELFSKLVGERDSGPAKIVECQEAFDKLDEQSKKKRTRPANTGEAGGGLSRFTNSGEGKTAKKKRKRQAKQAEAAKANAGNK